MRPLLISHAACAGHAPENSLAGIRKALDLGADGIEIDVQVSADGVPVLMHDLTVDRTTSGSGDVAALSLADLRALDAGGEPVPTLEEALSLTRGRALLVAEMKRPGGEAQIADVIRKSGALDGVMVWSFMPQALESMRAVEPSLPAALLIGPQGLPAWPDLRRLAVRLGLQGVSVFFAALSDQLALEAQRSGLAVYSWTVDAEAEMKRLLALGIDGLCTNYPDRLRALLDGVQA